MFTQDKKLNLILSLSYGAYVLLLIIITIDTLKIDNNFWVVWLLQLIPLLLLLPGILLKRHRTHSWLCFLMLAYFIGYVVQVYSSTRDPEDWLALLLTISLFITSMYASRWLQRIAPSIERKT